MPPIDFIGSAYRSQSVLADGETCVNWYEEAIESASSRAKKALYPTPGLSPIYQPPDIAGGVRGECTFLGRSFAVIGIYFFELKAPNLAVNYFNWSSINALQLASDGEPCSIAYGGDQILIASAGLAYVFNLTTNKLTAVDPSAGANLPIAQVAYSDGFFFALVENAAGTPWQINSSNALDATTWQAVDFTEVSVFPDNPSAIYITQRNLWVFGPDGIQPYTNTGDFPFPFDIIPGTYIEDGLAAPNSIVKFDGGPLIWLSGNKRGIGQVKLANGFTPIRVSDHALEYALQGYPTIADAFAYGYQDQGHPFYVLHLPTANVTWVLDLATKRWHRRGYWNQLRGTWDRSRAAFHTFNYGMHIVGDPINPVLYQMAINIGNDNGNPIVRERTGPPITKDQKYVFIPQVQADVEVGLATLPGNEAVTTITLEDAEGNLWSVQVTDAGALQVSPGSIGEPQTLFLNDEASATAWEIVPVPIDATHANLQPMLTTAPDAAFAPAQLMISVSGTHQYALTAKQVAAGIAQLVVNLAAIVGRGPLWTLQWSKDGGQSFSGGQDRQSGQLGKFRTRLLWNRLGRARGWVFRLRYSEAAPARVINFYADPPYVEGAAEKIYS